MQFLGWPDTAAILGRGQVHLGQNLVRAVPPGDQRFASCPLAAVELLAACHPSVLRDSSTTIEISKLAPHPLLLLDGSFAFRRNFDAAGPHTLLAMAERGHGVAVIPSALRTDRHADRRPDLTYRGKPLREPLALFWEKRRPLPRYATAFAAVLAQHMRNVFPVSRPTRLNSIPPRAASSRRRSSKSRVQ